MATAIGRARRVGWAEAMSNRLASWTYLSNHGHVLLAVARRPDIRVVDLAESVGLSVRAVQSILADLVADGSVERHHEGRRTAYRVHGEKHFRHPSLMDHEVGELLELFAPQPPAAAP